MKIYHYHKITGEYLRETTARQSPLEPGVYLIPAQATIIAPPQADDGYCAVFSCGAWRLIRDNRGIWYDANGEAVAIADIGASVEGLTQFPPIPELEYVKVTVQSANKSACRLHILSKYPEETQRNAALGIYGEEYAAACADFIARCIAIEDAAFDAVDACTTAEEIAAIPTVVFPEV